MPEALADMIDLLLDPEQRTVEPRVGQIGSTRMRVKSIDEAKRQVHFLCSTGDIDRYGEIVDQKALARAIPDFMLNPVFAAGHVYVGTSGEPTVIGHWVKLWVSDAGLEGIAEFDDEDPLAQRYWNLYRKGHMKAVSIGFLVKAWEMREQPGEQHRVRAFTEIELIEISAVAIGAARHALVRAASAARHTLGTPGDDTLETRLTPVIERILKKLLHAGPGGHLCTLLTDVAEAVRGPRGDSYDEGDDDGSGFDDDEDAPADPDPEQQEGADMIRELRAELGNARP